MTVRVATGLLDRHVIESPLGRLGLAACACLLASAALAADDVRLTEHFVVGWLFAVFAYCSAVMTTGLAWATGEARALEFSKALRRLLGPLVWGVVAYPAAAAALALFAGEGGLFAR